MQMKISTGTCYLAHWLLLVGLWLLLCPTTTLAFFASKPPATQSSKPTSTSTSTSSVDQAVAIYNRTFPFGRDPPQRNFLGDFGMPNQDFDGTRIKKESYQSNKRRRLTDITPKQAQQTYQQLVKLYGDERALQMVQAQPICLAFDSSKFAKSLDAWTNVFGLDAAQDMVARNPGLLAVRPDEASKAADSTMVFSYIVAATRPLGPILLAGLLFLLLTPAIQSLTGIHYGIPHS